MSARRLTSLLLPLLALAAIGCGNDDSTTTGAAESEAPPAAEESAAPAGGEGGASGEAKAEKPERTGTTIKLAGSAFGEILFDGDDQAIYLFDKETTDTSECYGDCAAEWPPVLTKGDPQAKGGISQGKLGTTERDDGTIQVTYNGHPLYYYFDEGPGIVACHNVPGFGGLWLVLDAAGNAV